MMAVLPVSHCGSSLITRPSPFVTTRQVEAASRTLGLRLLGCSQSKSSYRATLPGLRAAARVSTRKEACRRSRKGTKERIGNVMVGRNERWSTRHRQFQKNRTRTQQHPGSDEAGMAETEGSGARTRWTIIIRGEATGTLN